MSEFGTMRLLVVTLQHEHDVVLARQRARQVASLLRFDIQEQTQIATAVSEIARNAFTYAGGGKVEFRIVGKSAPQRLEICISDQGPGIPMLQSILDGKEVSATGTGRGLQGARRLMEQCDIQTSPSGTVITLGKFLSGTLPVLTPLAFGHLTEALAQQRPSNPLAAIQQQNQELLQTLEALRKKQDDLQQLNGELESTNRGLVALYAELDAQTERLRHANAVKTRFLSYMTHEFRVPIHSILALSGLLLDRSDGDLGEEQEKQVTFIRCAAEDTLALVNDLLDLGKIKAGKLTVHPMYFEIPTLFSALRGILRPLARNSAVTLLFEAPQHIPLLFTDENKVAQILRNLVSNALKFTKQGTVRVTAAFVPDETAVCITVTDTGMGIAVEDQERIFEEYVQLEHGLQRHIKGTGLGLPLCKELTTLLGGHLSVQSTLGAGTTFTVVLPLHYYSGETALFADLTEMK